MKLLTIKINFLIEMWKLLKLFLIKNKKLWKVPAKLKRFQTFKTANSFKTRNFLFTSLHWASNHQLSYPIFFPCYIIHENFPHQTVKMFTFSVGPLGVCQRLQEFYFKIFFSLPTKFVHSPQPRSSAPTATPHQSQQHITNVAQCQLQRLSGTWPSSHQL